MIESKVSVASWPILLVRANPPPPPSLSLTEQCGYDHAPVTRGRMRAQFPLPHGQSQSNYDSSGAITKQQFQGFQGGWGHAVGYAGLAATTWVNWVY